MRESLACKTILVVEDDAVLNDLVVTQLAMLGYAAVGATSWKAAEDILKTTEPDLVLLDIRLPDSDGLKLVARLSQQFPLIILTAYGSIAQAVSAMKAGASEFLTKPLNLEELEFAVQRTLENADMRKSIEFFKARQGAWRQAFMVGTSAALKRVEQLLDAVSDESATVLIHGESGVGKELLAREIHERSHRARKNFVAVDCCTLQEVMFETELFGYEEGAFPGATGQRNGLVDSANGGTLFLDEIAELSTTTQAKLVRMLETGTYRRLGGVKDLRCDARIIAATYHDLDDLAARDLFRKDLYYRVSGFAIRVPPLRARREDIPILARHLIANHDFSRRVSSDLTRDAERALLAYDWPGNVRELRNVIERAIILAGEGGVITAEHLGLNQSDVAPACGGSVQLNFEREPTLEELKLVYFSDLFRKYSGHRAQIADALGISERNVYRLIKRYGLSQAEKDG